MSEEVKLKKCTKCGEEKPEISEYFSKQSSCSNGLRPDCKVCRRKATKERLDKKLIYEDYNSYQECLVCKKSFQLISEFFYKSRQHTNGFKPICKECCRLQLNNKPKYDVIEDVNNTRLCNTCGILKPLNKEYFGVNRAKKNGLQYTCKECVVIYRKQTCSKEPNCDININKKCRICKVVKPHTKDFFHIRSKLKNGLNTVCKICSNKIELCRIHNKVTEEHPEIKRKCSMCCNYFPTTKEFFHQAKSGKYGLKAWCKECDKIKDKEFLENNLESVIRTRRKTYKKNKEKIIKRNNIYNKNRCKYDNSFKLLCKLRSRVNSAINKYRLEGKLMKAREYGIDYKAIIDHLQTPPNDYENYEVDHILPLSVFNFNDIEQIRIAFLAKNHQWLTESENCRKNNKFNPSDLFQYFKINYTGKNRDGVILDLKERYNLN